MTKLGLLNCVINTVLVVLMIIRMVTLENPINFFWLLVVIPALAFQWWFNIQTSKRRTS